MGVLPPIGAESTARHGQAGGLPLHSTRHTPMPSMLDLDALARHCSLHAQAAGLRPCHHTTHGHALRGPHTRYHRAVQAHAHPCPTTTCTAHTEPCRCMVRHSQQRQKPYASSLRWTVKPRCTLALRFLGIVNPVFTCQAKVQTDRLDNDNLRS